MHKRSVLIVALAFLCLSALAFIAIWLLQPDTHPRPVPGVALEASPMSEGSQPENNAGSLLDPGAAEALEVAEEEAEGAGVEPAVGHSEDGRNGPADGPETRTTDEPSQPAGLGGTGQQAPPQIVLSVTISGRVMDESGLGVADAVVMGWYRFQRAGGNDQQRHIPMRVAISGPAGHYTAVIQARVDEGTQAFEVALSARSAQLATTIPVLVAGLTPGDSRRGVDLTLVGGGTVTGRVVDQDGKPVSGAMVYGTPEAPLGKPPALPPGTLGKPIGDSARTGADGRYQLKNMPPGHWLIRATGPHHPFGTSAVVEVKTGETLTAADIVLRPGSGARLQLLTATGMPIHRDANGKLVRVDVHLTMSNGWETSRVAEPDEQGYILLTGMLLTTTEIRVEAQGYDTPDPLKLKLIAGQTIDLGELRFTPAQASQTSDLAMTTR